MDSKTLWSDMKFLMAIDLTQKNETKRKTSFLSFNHFFAINLLHISTQSMLTIESTMKIHRPQLVRRTKKNKHVYSHFW